VFDHVTIRVADPGESLRFYETVLGALGLPPADRSSTYAIGGEWDDFGVAERRSGERPTTRLHLGFGAASRDLVDAFWRAGVDAGYRSDGEPGERPQYSADYYGAFLLDPEGNSAEAVHHGSTGSDGRIDHVWIRVSDLAAARDFYTLVGEHADFRLHNEPMDPPRAHFRGAVGSFSVVDDGRPTWNVHAAFPAPDNAAVDAFHAALVGAGYRDNGAPGERPEYHAGYYGAFVLDPDGNNIELVCHNR
jgi:catechol 2,3-dioxygenase-like lactoylglutathione lyase family enzyme